MDKKEIFSMNFPDPTPLFGRKDTAARLDTVLTTTRQCVILLGPRGIGKSTFLKDFFSLDYRISVAKTCHQIITEPTPYPDYMTHNEVYAFFIETIEQACFELFSECGATDSIAALKNHIENDAYMISGASKINSLMNLLSKLGWFVTLVLDRFELFTSSVDVKEEHHGVMNSLVDKNGLRFVAATDYDLSRDSIMGEGAGSLLIQKFGAGELLLPPLNRSASDAIARAAEEARGLPPLTDLELKLAYFCSGGVPALQQVVLRYFWTEKLAYGAGLIKHFKCNQEQLYNDLVNEEKIKNELFQKWCKYLTSPQTTVLRELSKNDDSRSHLTTEAYDQAERALEVRGLLIRKPDGTCDYNGKLFKEYCQRAHQLAPEEPRVHKENDTEWKFDPESDIKEEEYQALGIKKEELLKLNRRVLEKVNDAIRVGRPARLWDAISDDERSSSWDYGAFISRFLTIYELHMQVCIYPLLVHWPEAERTRYIQSQGPDPVTKDSSKVTLGQYIMFLRRAKRTLSQRCIKNGLLDMDDAWWKRLVKDADRGRLCRNAEHHPDEPLNYMDVLNGTAELDFPDESIPLGHATSSTRMTYQEARTILDLYFKEQHLFDRLLRVYSVRDKLLE